MKKIFYILLFSAFTTFTSPAQDTQGFFLNDFQPKTFIAPAYTEYTKPTKTPTTNVSVDFTNQTGQVSKYIFGNNANVWMGQIVDQPDLMANINTLSPNIIRFPGGSLSGVYFWNQPKDAKPADAPTQIPDATVPGQMNNIGYWYGGNTENWTISLDNYYVMLQQTASTGMITVNYDYARYSTAPDPVASAAHLAADWVRYDNGRTKYWEIGNENHGTWQPSYRIKLSTNQDGQPEIQTGELYGKHFKVFADSMRKAATEIGSTIYIGCQMLQETPPSWATSTEKNWNTGVLSQTGNSPDYYIIHSYYTPYATNSPASVILNSATTVTKDMMSFVTAAMTTAGVTIKPVALTEWNIFAEGSKQQTSFINGMHAALLLGELASSKYGMASRWDFANGWNNGNDHGIFNIGDQPGSIPKWSPRPAFYYMYYFQKYMGDHMVNTTVSGSSDVVAYASSFDFKQAAIMIVNKATTEQTVNLNISNFGYGDRYYVYNLVGGTDNGEFSLKVLVNGQGPGTTAGGPDVTKVKAMSALIGDGVKISSPARSVQFVVVENGSNIITATENQTKEQFTVYPNPSKGDLHIELPSAGFTKAELVDSRGNRMMTQPVDPTRTAVEVKTNVPPGLYLIRLMRRDKVLSSKVLIE